VKRVLQCFLANLRRVGEQLAELLYLFSIAWFCSDPVGVFVSIAFDAFLSISSTPERRSSNVAHA